MRYVVIDHNIVSFFFPFQRGRQWIGELAAPVDCSFPVDVRRNATASNNSPVERVSLCNFTTSGPLVDGVLPWRKGLASLGNWLGGPETDASNSTDGNLLSFRSCLLLSNVIGLPRIYLHVTIDYVFI